MRFSFIFSDSLQGSKIAFNGFYLFGGILQRRERKRLTEGKKSKRERATATSERNATPRTAQFFGASRLFLGSVVLSAGWNGKRAIQAIFHGFTAHGLKARQGFPTSHRKRSRSDNRKHADRQPLCQPLGQPKSPDAPMREENVGGL